MKREPKLQIIWQTDRLVAVHKPPGLAAIPGRAETDSVLEQLAALLGIPHKGEADPRVRVVHRLDKDTQRHLSHQFQNNRVEKEYLAICTGHPPAREGEIDAPMCVNPAAKTRMM